MSPKKPSIAIIFNIFKVFGFIPNSTDHNLILQKISSIITITFVIFYWIALALTFSENEFTSDRLNVMTNWIQLLINATTLTIILIFPIVNIESVREIFKQVEKFDLRISKMGLKVDERNVKSFTISTILFSSIFMIYLISYEIYIIIFKYNLCSFYYWTISFIPYLIYSASLCFSFCLLLQILTRVKTVAKILETETRWDLKIIKSKANDVQSIRSQIPSVFHLYSEILEFSIAVERFLGPFFLAAFTSIFIVTTTQIYHCYCLIVTKQSEKFGFSVWSIVLCVNIIVANLTSMLAVISISERIGSEVIIKF